jgi:hypothetical protein
MIIHLQDVERATEPTTPLFGNGLLEDIQTNATQLVANTLLH